MKKVKTIYWITTALISLMMAFSMYAYLSNDMVKGNFVRLGFPSYFRIELAFAKLLGAIVLIVPAIKGVFKEWAYFGFFITFVSALIAHISSGDPAAGWAPAAFAMVLLLVSYFSYNRLSASSLQQTN